MLTKPISETDTAFDILHFNYPFDNKQTFSSIYLLKKIGSKCDVLRKTLASSLSSINEIKQTYAEITIECQSWLLITGIIRKSMKIVFEMSY